MKKILLLLAFATTTLYGQLNSTWQYYERDFKAYLYNSIDDPPVPGCTLFAGSSSFRMWGDLEQRFADYEAVNRAFGGSNYVDNLSIADLLHLPCRASRVLIFCGTNDLASGVDEATVFRRFKDYLGLLWNENPLTEVFFVAVTHAPVREKFWPKGDMLNKHISELAGKIHGLNFIDVVRLMQDADGHERSDLWLNDRLHPNKTCYDIWEKAIREAIGAQTKQSLLSAKPDIRKIFAERKAEGLWDEIPAKTPQMARDLNIVFIGNSITIGGGEQSPPARCAAYLRQQAAVGEVDYSNQGVSGFTTVDFNFLGQAFAKVLNAAKTLQQAHPERQLIFSVMLGTNDSAIKGTNGAPVAPTQYRDNMKMIVDALIEAFPQCRVTLQRPVWYSDNTQNSATYLREGQMRVEAYYDELQQLVRYYDLISPVKQVYVGDNKAFAWFRKHHKEAMKPETGAKGTFYLHPNEKGMDVLGRFWGAAIVDALSD